MRNIKTVIVRYLRATTLIMVLLVILLAVFLQAFHEQKITRINTADTFSQVKQLLELNSRELEENMAAYRETSIKNAKTIAYIISSDPSFFNFIDNSEDGENIENSGNSSDSADIENTGIKDLNSELVKIAELVEVDEINLFNEDGVIFAGTNPEYYNMSVNDGDQIGFFKQMLGNKSLTLFQELTPNTASFTQMQYSAAWSPDGTFFVQVGMNQETVRNITKRNEMSYVFTQINVNSAVDLIATDSNLVIIAASDPSKNGKTIESLGIKKSTASTRS